MKKQSVATERIDWVDSLRGIAIILMVGFHFCYDLDYFGWVDWHVPNGSGWWQFRYVILSLFIFTTGMSLTLAHGRRIRWKPYAVRLGQMALAAGAITLMSVFMFPSAWIYFGILHFLLISSLVGIFFVGFPLAALAAGLLIVLLYGVGLVDGRWPFNFISGLPVHTEDYVPIFPWLGVSLFGVAFAGFFSLAKIQRGFCFLPKLLSGLGRHGLVIYLVHQPILFGLLYLVTVVF